MLPKVVQEYLSDTDSSTTELVSSVATLHVLKSSNGETKKLAELNFNFGNAEEVKKYHETISLLNMIVS